MITNFDRNKLIGERVRFYRTTKGWSLGKLANALPSPISGQQLAKYETGRAWWRADTICDMAKIFRVDVRLLLGLEDGKHEGKDEYEWEAEKYKNVLLSLPLVSRRFFYNQIDGLSKLKKEVERHGA